ncbi:MAG: alpha/beta fold hydrolase [Nitriliruptorales bacterium]|nr:alpha/beta fold hydrolase [Nitriliruptorales bacterium]
MAGHHQLRGGLRRRAACPARVRRGRQVVRRRALALAGFAAAAAGGAAMGWAAERRLLRHEVPTTAPDWPELRRPAPGEAHRVESYDGTHLHVDIVGPEGAPTVVMAHGYALSHRAWHFQRRELSDEFRVVTYDQRGHGASEEAVSGDYSIGAFGRDLSAVVESVTPTAQAVILVGHSMGGMTILSYVDQYPEWVGDRVAGAVFMSTSGSEVITGGIVSVGVAAFSGLGNRVGRRVFQALGRRSSAADLIYSSSNDLSYGLTKLIGLTADASPAHVAFTEQLLLECPNNVKAAIGPMFTSLDLREAAPLLKVPSLVIVGDKDRLTPPRQAHRLVELLPDAELAVLEGIGHMAPIEAHADVTAHIRAFARRVLPS